jgi:hypothetical protein
MHPILPLDLVDSTFLVEGFTTGLSSTQLLVLRMRQLERREDDLRSAAKALKKARFRSKEEFEKKYRKRMRKEFYKSGELVLVRNSEQEMRLNRKTKPRYLGPYEVCRRTEGGSYVLKELDGTMFREGTAAYRLLQYVSRHDIELLKEIAKEIADEEEGSGTDIDWYSNSDEESNYEEEEEEEWLP